MQQSLVQGPTAEPVSLAQAISHLREDTDTEQADLIRRLTRMARQHVEGYTRRILVRQSWKATCSRFPRVIELPVLPVRSVTSIQYVDSAGTTQTLSSSSYQVDYITEDRVQICPVYGETWPAVQPGTFNAVTVNFIAGHAVPFTTDYNADANQCSATAHPLSDDDQLQVWTSGTALPDGLDAYTNYFVVNAATNTFELSLSSGGSPIAFTADGKGDVFAGEIPEPLIGAILLLLSHWFENREGVLIGTTAMEMPLGVEALLMPYASVRF